MIPYILPHLGLTLLTLHVALMDSIKADHGFNMDSKSVRNLLQTMSELTLSERRDFLQFTTGSPKLPIGGTCIHHWGVILNANTCVRFQKSHPDVYSGLQTE